MRWSAVESPAIAAEYSSAPSWGEAELLELRDEDDREEARQAQRALDALHARVLAALRRVRAAGAAPVEFGALRAGGVVPGRVSLNFGVRWSALKCCPLFGLHAQTVALRRRWRSGAGRGRR